MRMNGSEVDRLDQLHADRRRRATDRPVERHRPDAPPVLGLVVALQRRQRHEKRQRRQQHRRVPHEVAQANAGESGAQGPHERRRLYNVGSGLVAGAHGCPRESSSSLPVCRLHAFEVMSARASKKFVAKMPRSTKQRAGRTRVTETPLRIRVSGVDLTPAVEKRTRALLGRRLARFGTFIERAEVRFKDVNGPARGGVDTRCRIKLTVSRRPSVFVEERALDANRALTRAGSSVARAMARSVEREGLPTLAPTRAAPAAPSPAARPKSQEAPAAAQGRRRPNRRGMIYVLEESATKPSRKSTRKSANRQKGGSKLQRRTQRRKHTPKARASRAQSNRARSRAGR